jgi:sialate O-acetylesterase
VRAALLALLVLAPPASADVVLHGLFGDDMVLQRDAKVPVWGRADPGEEVKVRFAGDTRTTTADAQGRWRVELGPLAATAGRKLVVQGRNRVTLRGVCVGDVWICSGQSNMAWPVRAAANAKEEIRRSDDPRLRLFTVPHRVSGEPQADVTGRWTVAGPEAVVSFSAVAFFFGTELRRVCRVPVGLIHTSWGGTPAEAWTREATLRRDDTLLPIVERWEDALRDWPATRKVFEERLQKWKEKAETARAAGQRPPRRPRPPRGPDHPHRASGLFNGMVAPLLPFAIRGAIWYQGESNAGRAEQYRRLFPAMIRDWRAAWGAGDFPFLFVQLANFRARKPQPADSDWAELREAQALALNEPNTGMAVAIDIGEARNIHPKNKQEVGRRLALAAQAVAYGDKNVVASGPRLTRCAFEGGRVVAEFDQKVVTADGEPPRGFAVAGSDRKFHWADAIVKGRRITFSCAAVPEPVALRYAWADNPDGNVVNREGLPAPPFRTDDWPGLTAGRR